MPVDQMHSRNSNTSRRHPRGAFLVNDPGADVGAPNVNCEDGVVCLWCALKNAATRTFVPP